MSRGQSGKLVRLLRQISCVCGMSTYGNKGLHYYFTALVSALVIRNQCTFVCVSTLCVLGSAVDERGAEGG